MTIHALNPQPAQPAPTPRAPLDPVERHLGANDLGDVTLAQASARTAALDGFTNDPGTAFSTPAAVLGGDTAKVAPFFSRFHHSSSRPTFHEWLQSLRFEGGDYALRNCAECLGSAGVPGSFQSPVHGDS